MYIYITALLIIFHIWYHFVLLYYAVSNQRYCDDLIKRITICCNCELFFQIASCFLICDPPLVSVNRH